MSRKKLHNVGDEIFAKWPGSDRYYSSVVVGRYDKSNDSYSVKFEDDGDPIDILAKHITTPSQAKLWRSRSASPARTSGRRKRRSRSKSPTRSSRQRSPARRKPPTRRQRKLQEEESPLRKEEAMEQKKFDAVDNAINVEEKHVIVQSSDVIHEEQSSRVTRKRVTRSVSRIQQEIIQQQAQEIKQTADATEEKQQMTMAQHGWSCEILALAAMFIIPLMLMSLYLVAGSKSHPFLMLRLPEMPTFDTLFNWKVAVALGVWYDVQFLLTKIPLGKIVNGPITPDGEQLTYRMNGMIHTLLHLALIGIGIYQKSVFKVAAMVDEYYLSIAFSSIVWSFLTAFLAPLKALFDSRVKNKYITPESFVAGKEQNPTIFGFDLKWCCSRAGFIGWIVLDCMFILKHYSDAGCDVNKAACFIACSHVVYMLLGLVIEEGMIKSPTMNETPLGFGFILLSLSFMPFFYSMQVLYLVRYKPSVTNVQWGAAIALQLVGVYIFLKSNMEKAEFRRDPKKMMKRDVKVVFTANGKNLLADGWWGRLRHPNYFGDILVAISWGIPAGCSHLAPWLYPLYLIGLLVLFAVEDEKRCAKKYGLSWDEYKARVKYVMIPYVY